jgi:HrpA-like RNA helicase
MIEGHCFIVLQYLLEAGWCENNLRVGVAEPRRFCATTLAQRVSEEQRCKLGTDVGYTIRFDDCSDAKTTKIKVSSRFLYFS